jgi:hypothetical protein
MPTPINSVNILKAINETELFLRDINPDNFSVIVDPTKVDSVIIKYIPNGKEIYLMSYDGGILVGYTQPTDDTILGKVPAEKPAISMSTDSSLKNSTTSITLSELRQYTNINARIPASYTEANGYAQSQGKYTDQTFDTNNVYKSRKTKYNLTLLDQNSNIKPKTDPNCCDVSTTTQSSSWNPVNVSGINEDIIFNDKSRANSKDLINQSKHFLSFTTGVIPNAFNQAVPAFDYCFTEI